MDKPVFDSRSIKYKTPFGAVCEGSVINFTICLPPSYAFCSAVLNVFTRDGYVQKINMVYRETIDDLIYYKCEFTPKEANIYFYDFTINCSGNISYIKRSQSGVGIITNDVNKRNYQLTVYYKSASTSSWFKGGIAYQIFPDRFYKSNKLKENVPADRVIHNNIEEEPVYLPDENGEVLNNDYYGGDLLGVEKKLPYLKSLGVSIIYLNPIFEAHSNHRYNTANYMKIDPLLGNDDDFKRLCKKASQLSIKIILDGVFNHTGDDSLYFNRYNRYDTQGAYNSQSSVYYPWYVFSQFPNNYHSWWGFKSLPTINKDSKEYIDFICGENGVLKKWLGLGASGYRLDVADELPADFIEKIRHSIKSENKEHLLIGEVWEDATNKEAYGVLRKYFLGRELDGVMNYPFKSAIINLLKYQEKENFINNIMDIVENYPPHALNVTFNSLSTHDIPRAITALAGLSCEGKDRLWQASHSLGEKEYKSGVELLKCAMVLQYFLPGIPCIYYGDEVGLEGYKDPFNRKCYPWGNENTDLLEFSRNLGVLRNSFSLLKDGKIEFLYSDGKTISFRRYNDNNELIVYLNYSIDTEIINYDIKKYKLKYGSSNGNGEIALTPYSFALLYR